MNSEDVAAYLKQNPAFFNEYGDMLADIEIEPGAPFHQRQIEVLRKRNSEEKQRYEMVVESARNNQALERSVHEFACNLLASKSDDDGVIAGHLVSGFGVEAVRLCRSKDSELASEDIELLIQRVKHGSSICDDRVSSSLLVALFGEGNTISSCAFVPLKQGVLVLGSNDPKKFVPGMGPIYLDRIGDLVSALLSDEPG